MSKQIKLLTRHHKNIFNDTTGRTSTLMAASAMAGMSVMYFVNNPNQTESQVAAAQSSSSSSASSLASSNSKATPSHVGIIETDLTEKIASKPYLNYHNPFARDSIITSARNTSKKIWNKFARNDRSSSSGVDLFDNDNVMEIVGGAKQLVQRPKGIPRRVRILAIDVPEFREVFDGECRVNLARVYPDDIAPAKYVPRKGHDNDNGQDVDSKHNTDDRTDEEQKSQSKGQEEKEKHKKKKDETKDEPIEVIQKSLARSLVRCRNVHSKKIGVELLEASVYDLNPNNMRRTYQFGSYRYDPGKYGSMNRAPGDDMLQRRITAYGSPPGSPPSRRRSRSNKNSNDMVVTKSKTTEINNNDEDAPGDVEDIVDEEEHNKNNNTTSPHEKTVLASEDDEVDAPWNQYAWIEEMELRIHGHIPFGANVERCSWLSRKLFGTSYRSTVKKVSSSPLLWFVPSFLIGNKPGGYDGVDGDYGNNRRTINRASSKPHAVIADGSAMQRVPGALRYLTKCCQEADVPLFIINDPRVWGGNTHQDLESAAKDIRKTFKARIVSNVLTIKEGSMFERGRIIGKLETETKWQIKDAGRRTREAVQSAAARLQKEREENWNELDSSQLLERLIDRNVLRLESGKIKDAGAAKAFGELCRQYLDNGKKLDEDVSSSVETPPATSTTATATATATTVTSDNEQMNDVTEDVTEDESN